MHAEVKGSDLPGLKALMKRMLDASRNVLIGVPGGADPEADGTPMAEVGAVHEFGCPERNIPERSWLRGGIHSGEPKFNRLNRASLVAILRGEKSVENALSTLGEVAVGEVKRYFLTAEFKPLAPLTIAHRMAKISPKRIAAHNAKVAAGIPTNRLIVPLIDTGSLRQSITYVLEGKQSAKARVIR
jgi:hypothetical protein